MTTPDGLTAESEARLETWAGHLTPDYLDFLRETLVIAEAAAVARHVAAERGTPSAVETGCDGLREALVSLLDEVDESSSRLFNAAAIVRAALAPTVAASAHKGCRHGEVSAHPGIGALCHVCGAWAPFAPSPAIQAELRGGEG